MSTGHGQGATGSGSGNTATGGARGVACCPMRPLFLETVGEPLVAWQVWVAMFKDHMIAYGQDELTDARKVAILKSSLGAEGYRICMSLCTEHTLSIDDILGRLGNRFAPKVGVICARAVFHRRAQVAGESCIQFVTALRTLMAKCGYNDGMQAELLRDRFVAGCSSDKIREKLMLEPDDLSLDGALLIANNCERVAVESRQVSGSASADDSSVMRVAMKGRARSQGRDATCFACGRPGHRRGDAKCSAQGKQCKSCGESGHFAVCCKRKQQAGADRSMIKGRFRPGQQSSARGSTVVGLIDVSAAVVSKRFSKSKAVACRLNGVELCLIFDTGAVSILNSDTVARLQVHISVSDAVLKTYDGTVLDVLGVVSLSVRCADRCVDQFPFFVVKSGVNIMGLDLYEALGYRIDIPTCHNVASCAQCQCCAVTTDDVQSAGEQKFREQYAELFEPPETITGYVHKPKVDASVVPHVQPLRRVPLALSDDVSKELGRMVKEGILEPIDTSEWVSNMVVVRKASGGIRICCDLSDVNQAVVADKYPLPTMDELSSEFAGAKWFSKIDLRWGYLQVPLDADSRCLTAMLTPIGLFQWARLPPGLCSAPSCFQKIMALILTDCEGVVHLLDDILVGGRTRQQHDVRLHKVLCRLRDAHVRLHNEKTVFAVQELDFAGFHVSERGVSPLKSNVAAVQAIGEPTNVRLLRSFLGSVGFYSKFIAHFAEVAEPLYELLRKGVAWQWSRECADAFECLKGALITEPLLTHFDQEARTIVESDASDVAIGCVLLQLQDGVEKPVAFASRVLNSAEQGYSVCEKEALACLYACEHWHYYLYGRKFVLRTDHKALTTLLNHQGTGRKPLRLHRWYDRLNVYDFKVEYKVGATNCMADLLSRSFGAERRGADSTAGDIQEHAESVASIFGDSRVSLVSEMELAEATACDELLCTVAKYIKTGWPTVHEEVSSELKPYVSEKDVLSICNNIIMHSDAVVVPVSLRDRFVTLAHEGHSGVVRTLQRVRETAWWPGVSTFVRNKVANCVACLQNSVRNTTRCTPLIPVEWPVVAWSKIGIDIVGELSAVPFTKRFAITVIDYHSRWPEVHFCSNVTSQVVIKFLTELFARWGIPEVLVSDNGVQFVSGEFESFLRSCDIKHIKSSLYYPQSNGLVERFNSSVKQAVRTAVAEGKPPDVAVRDLLVAYRSTPQPATGVSPARLMLGRQIRVPANSLISRLQPEEKRQVQFADQDTIHAIQGNVRLQQDKMTAQFNRRHRACQPKVKVGDWVRVSVPKKKKTSASFSVPHKIAKFVAPFTVLLDNNARWHLSKVKKCSAPSTCDAATEAVAVPDEAEVSGAGTDVDHTLVRVPQPPSSPPPALRRSCRPKTLPSWLRDGDYITN